MIKYKQVKKAASAIAGETSTLQIVETAGCTGKEIAQLIEKEIGIPAIRTMSVLSAVAEYTGKILAEGKSVKLEGLGTFKAVLALYGGVPEIRKVRFTSSAEIKNVLKDVALEEVAD